MKNITIIYNCTSIDEDIINKCELIKGAFKISDKIIQCS